MPNRYYDPPERIAAWHEFRRRHVMASDTPDLAGVGYRSALEVFADKVAPAWAGDDDLGARPNVRAGLLCEPAIARWAELELGSRLVEPPWCESAAHPFLGATADREDPDHRYGVEMKKVGRHNAHRWGNAGTDDVPEAVLIQCHQQMHVYDWPRCYVAALIGEDDFRLYELPRNDALIAGVVALATDFWAKVQANQPPEADYDDPRAAELLNAIRPPVPGVDIILPPEAAQLARDYLFAGEEARQATARRNALQARLIAAMGDACRARAVGDAGTYDLSRTLVSRKAYEVKATEYVRFGCSEPQAARPPRNRKPLTPQPV